MSYNINQLNPLDDERYFGWYRDRTLLFVRDLNNFVPPALFDEHQLTNLVLSELRLSTLPWLIGQLKSLQLLDLSTNNLIELPQEIGLLTKLRSLMLYK